MFVRSTRVALALSLAVPAALAAQGFEYMPVSAQYRVTQSTKAAQEVMGQKQEFESSNNQLFSLTLARASKDTMTMTVVLDSINSMGPMGPVPGLEKLYGYKVSAKLSPMGVLYSTQTPKNDTIANGSQIAESMGSFLPRIRARLAAGATWSDTSSGKVDQNGVAVDRKVVSTYTVVGDTTVGSEKAWKIARVTNAVMSGSGAPQGQPMTMEGTSNGKGDVFVSQKGVFLGGQGVEDAKVKIVLAANGMEVNVTTTSTVKIDKVK